MIALANLQSWMDRIHYETLRSSVRDIPADNIPQAHEVTRVLEKLPEITATDESSTPVLDWQSAEQVLHITDPFFVLYLKWGTTSLGDNGS